MTILKAIFGVLTALSIIGFVIANIILVYSNMLRAPQKTKEQKEANRKILVRYNICFCILIVSGVVDIFLFK